MKITRELFDIVIPEEFRVPPRRPFCYGYTTIKTDKFVARANSIIDEDRLPFVAEKLNELLERNGVTRGHVANMTSKYMNLAIFYRLLCAKNLKDSVKGQTDSAKEKSAVDTEAYPTREHIYLIAVCAGFTWNETEELLDAAGLTYVYCKVDAIYKYVIEKGEPIENALYYFHYFGLGKPSMAV